MPATSVKFTGNLLVNLKDSAQPAPEPIEWALAAYSQKAIIGVDFSTAQTDLAVADGSITAPKVLYVELISGVLDLKWDVDAGTVPTRLSMDADPVPTYRAQLMMFTPVGTARTLYISSPGAVRANIWLFQ